MAGFPTLRSGDRAFWDSFAGLVPIRVLAIRGESGPPSSRALVDFEITAARGPYKPGERFTDQWSIHTVPPRAVHRRRYSTTIGFYRVEVDQ